MRRLGLTAMALLATVVTLLPWCRPVDAGTAAAPSPETVTAPPVLSLPAPTGRLAVGTATLHLVDGSRRDPWVASHPPRELMTQLWYPAARTAGHPPAHYIPALAGRSLDEQTARALGTPVPAGTFNALRTHSHLDAPVARRGEHGRPVVLFSPGDGMDRSSLTSVAEDLASHGFVVAGIDDTHDSGQVEFPGGRVEVAQPIADPDQETLVRAADASFVLDMLARLDAGADPDAEHRPVPDFRHALDLRRVGMFGHSHGAESTAETMLRDPRVSAGAELDGGVSDRVAAAGLTHPYMVISGDSAVTHPKTEENLTALWPRLTGWNRWLRVRGAGHLAFTDFDAFAAQLGVPAHIRQDQFGTLTPGRVVAIERAYLFAFFAWQLDHRDERLLDEPSPRYPDVVFER